MGITKASTVEIDTSIFSTDFKEAFKSDSLGHLKYQAGDAANFSIDAKTGKLTSTTAIAAATYSFDVVYTNRAGTAHTEEITMIASAASEATLADIKVETTANAHMRLRL